MYFSGTSGAQVLSENEHAMFELSTSTRGQGDKRIPQKYMRHYVVP